MAIGRRFVLTNASRAKKQYHYKWPEQEPQSYRRDSACRSPHHMNYIVKHQTVTLVYLSAADSLGLTSVHVTPLAPKAAVLCENNA